MLETKSTPIPKPKKEAAKPHDFLDEDLKDMGNVASLIGSENIVLVLKIGSDSSPAYREIAMNNTAYELKQRV